MSVVPIHGGEPDSEDRSGRLSPAGVIKKNCPRRAARGRRNPGLLGPLRAHREGGSFDEESAAPAPGETPGCVQQVVERCSFPNQARRDRRALIRLVIAAAFALDLDSPERQQLFATVGLTTARSQGARA
jgi:hypothetical protein